MSPITIIFAALILFALFCVCKYILKIPTVISIVISLILIALML